MNTNEREKFFLSAYHTHSDAIFRYCFFKLSDREQALDAVQEIFMRMWRYLEQGKEVQLPKAFLFVTASNYVKDQWRKKKTIPLSSLETDDEGQEFQIPDESVDQLERAEYQLALRAFSKLPDEDRLLLQLRFVEGMGVKDIAAMLDERDNTIAVRISRAIGRLRNEHGYKHG